MTELFDGPPGSSPLEPDDQDGLIPTWIATRADLNAAEQANIAKAAVWVSARTWKVGQILSRDWLRVLHTRMLGEVWEWAGTWRKRETNLGLPPGEIETALEDLVHDVQAQVTDMSPDAWSSDEVAIRFHHRLVSIHPFANGNGRHARLAADELAVSLGRPRFSWGGGEDLTAAGAVRSEYMAALKAADLGDIGPLMAFARMDR